MFKWSPLMFLPNIKIVKTNLCVFRLLALHRIESTQRTSSTRGGVSSSFPLPFPPIVLLGVLNQLLIWFKSRSWYNLTPLISFNPSNSGLDKHSVCFYNHIFWLRLDKHSPSDCSLYLQFWYARSLCLWVQVSLMTIMLTIIHYSSNIYSIWSVHGNTKTMNIRLSNNNIWQQKYYLILLNDFPNSCISSSSIRHCDIIHDANDTNVISVKNNILSSEEDAKYPLTWSN